MQRNENDLDENIVYCVRPLEVEEEPFCHQPIDNNSSSAIVTNVCQSVHIASTIIEWRETENLTNAESIN